MAKYNLELQGGDTLKVGFGDPGTNPEILAELQETLPGLGLSGGKLLKIDGPASLPVACFLAHGVGHLYGAVAVKDPKLGAFVVAISHDPNHPVGSVLPE